MTPREEYSMASPEAPLTGIAAVRGAFPVRGAFRNRAAAPPAGLLPS
jgi:hypothetical protein